MSTWLSDFYRTHPEYRHLRVAKRSHNSIHFEIEPGIYEAHIVNRPMHARTQSGLYLPLTDFVRAARLARQFIRTPQAALQFAAYLPFAVSPLTLQPDDTTGVDTYINKQFATNNYGISTVMECGEWVGIAGATEKPLMQFDISSLPAGQTITAATLTLVTSATTADSLTLTLYRGLTQWYEGAKNGAAPDVGQNGSTWNLRNANGSVAWGAAGGLSGTDYSASASAATAVTTAGTYNWTGLATDVAAWYGGTATNYGWWLVKTAGATNYKQINSSGTATAGNRPKLVISYTAAATGRSFAVIVG